MAEQTLTAESKPDVEATPVKRGKPDGALDPLGEVGWYLQRERVSRAETLRDIAKITRLNPVHLAAIEHGDTRFLPKGTQVFTVLGTYADYLGFEPQPLINHYTDVLRNRSLTSPRPSPMSAAVVWFGDYTQRAANMAANVNRRGVIAALSAMMVGAVGYLAVQGFDGERGGSSVRQVAEAPNSSADDEVTGAIAKKSPTLTVAREAKSRNAGVSTHGDRRTREVLLKTVEQTKKTPGAANTPDREKVPDISIQERELSRDIDASKTLVPIEGSRLAALIAREIADAVKTASVPIKQPDALDRLIQQEIGSELATGSVAPGTQKPETPAAKFGLNNKDARLVLKAREPVWIRVEDKQGGIIFTRTFAAGESYRVPNVEGLVLDARNAGALDFYVDGKITGSLGQPGEIVIGLPLDLTKLAARQNKP